MPSPDEITIAQLNRLVGSPDCPPVVDICIDPDFNDDPYLIPGAFRHPHTDLSGLIGRLSARACVVTCQKGLKLSQGVAAWLRAEGVAAEVLQGGMFAWRDAPDTLRLPAAAIPATVGGTTLWVAGRRPETDQIACAWLIRRFVDRDARFLFVEPSAIDGVAEKFGATPFGGGGDAGGFDAMLKAFELHSEALDRLAHVARAAGPGRPMLAPEAAGLRAVLDGLSRQFGDDQALLAAALPVFDALYLWARDGFDADGET